MASALVAEVSIDQDKGNIMVTRVTTSPHRIHGQQTDRNDPASKQPNRQLARCPSGTL